MHSKFRSDLPGMPLELIQPVVIPAGRVGVAVHRPEVIMEGWIGLVMALPEALVEKGLIIQAAPVTVTKEAITTSIMNIGVFDVRLPKGAVVSQLIMVRSFI